MLPIAIKLDIDSVSIAFVIFVVISAWMLFEEWCACNTIAKSRAGIMFSDERHTLKPRELHHILFHPIQVPPPTCSC